MGVGKTAVMFCGWGCFLISLGLPRVMRAHMGDTCGEPNEIELTALTDGITASFCLGPVRAMSGAG